MATNNAINLATPTSNTLSITNTSGAIAINTNASLQTSTKVYVGTQVVFIPYYITIAP